MLDDEERGEIREWFRKLVSRREREPRVTAPPADDLPLLEDSAGDVRGGSGTSPDPPNESTN